LTALLRRYVKLHQHGKHVNNTDNFSFYQKLVQEQKINEGITHRESDWRLHMYAHECDLLLSTEQFTNPASCCCYATSNVGRM